MIGLPLDITNIIPRTYFHICGNEVHPSLTRTKTQVNSIAAGMLLEVMVILPSTYMHSFRPHGGVRGSAISLSHIFLLTVQCPKVRWAECERCQRRIAEEGLADEYELQSWCAHCHWQSYSMLLESCGARTQCLGIQCLPAACLVAQSTSCLTMCQLLRCMSRCQAGEAKKIEDEWPVACRRFVGRIGAFLARHGRILVGWDEILEGTADGRRLPPDAVVMSWRVSVPAQCYISNRLSFEDKRAARQGQGQGLAVTRGALLSLARSSLSSRHSDGRRATTLSWQLNNKEQLPWPPPAGHLGRREGGEGWAPRHHDAHQPLLPGLPAVPARRRARRLV